MTAEGLATAADAAAVAVIVVRDGTAPLGADEAVAEAGGRAVLAGTGTDDVAPALPSLRSAWCADLGDFAAGRWAARLAPALRGCGPIVLPASADGRDLAPRLAATLRRPLLAGAVWVGPTAVEVLRYDGRVALELAVDGPFVATLQPGVRGGEPADRAPELRTLRLPEVAAGPDATVLEVLPPDPATVDLTEARRILTAGGGLARGELAGPEAVALLGDVARALGASVGATRIVTDAGWAPHERQVGTTGVVVKPQLYVAFGVSGAAQHLGGLHDPRHVVSVNTDPSCPMTAMADLGIVADAAAVLTELSRLLACSRPKPEGLPS